MSEPEPALSAPAAPEVAGVGTPEPSIPHDECVEKARLRILRQRAVYGSLGFITGVLVGNPYFGLSGGLVAAIARGDQIDRGLKYAYEEILKPRAQRLGRFMVGIRASEVPALPSPSDPPGSPPPPSPSPAGC